MIKKIYPKKISLKQDNQLNKIYNKYFNKKSKNEANLNIDKINILIKKFPKSEEIIVDKGIIGEITIIPTNKKIMNLFLKNKINEQKLLDRSISEVNVDNFNCIYLCYFLILDKYRHKKIMYKELKKTIKYYKKINPKITLFVWPFSKAGKNLSEKVSNKLNLPLILKE